MLKVPEVYNTSKSLHEVGGTAFHELSAKSDQTSIPIQSQLSTSNILSLCPSLPTQQTDGTVSDIFSQDPFNAKRTTGLIITPDQHEVRRKNLEKTHFQISSVAKSKVGSFHSIQWNIPLYSGKWYYEVTIHSGGLLQIGWATNLCEFRPEVHIRHFSTLK